MAPAALIVDLDGTLWDSHPWFAGLLATGDDRARETALGKLRAAVPAATLLREGGITRVRFRKLCSGPPRVDLYPGVRETLGELRELDVPVGAVTNLPGWVAKPMLACHGLDAFVGSLVTYERTRRRKPHPEPLLLACEELDVDADEEVWYVGDAASDCAAAVAARLSFAWVTWGYGKEAPDGADMTLASFEQVLAL